MLLVLMLECCFKHAIAHHYQCLIVDFGLNILNKDVVSYMYHKLHIHAHTHMRTIVHTHTHSLVHSLTQVR